ncbi:MAG: hypothetical protein AAFN40_09655 [Cyanobacteria bacterium J06560_6]
MLSALQQVRENWVPISVFLFFGVVTFSRFRHLKDPEIETKINYLEDWLDKNNQDKAGILLPVFMALTLPFIVAATEEEIPNLIPAFTGIFIFFLGQKSERAREKEKQLDRQANIFKALSSEIAGNLSVLEKNIELIERENTKQLMTYALGPGSLLTSNAFRLILNSSPNTLLRHNLLLGTLKILSLIDKINILMDFRNSIILAYISNQSPISSKMQDAALKSTVKTMLRTSKELQNIFKEESERLRELMK